MSNRGFPYQCLANNHFYSDERTRPSRNEIKSIEYFCEALEAWRLILVTQYSEFCRGWNKLFFDAIQNLEWFVRCICSQIDNREIASLILLLVMAVFVLVKDRDKGILKSFKDVLVSVFQPIILFPAVLIIVYSILLIWVAALLNLWTTDFLLDTILEIAFVGLPALAIAANAHSIRSIIKQLVLPTIRLGSFAAFYINIDSFPILVELLLQAVIIFLACGKPLLSRKQSDRHTAVFIDWALAIVGLLIFAGVTFRLISSWDTINWLIELKRFLMTIWYPALLMPLVILLAFYAAYDSMFRRSKSATSRIGAPEKIFLSLEMFPSLRNITHFSCYEAGQYSKCISWRERHFYCKEYKKEVKTRAIKENAKLKRMELGKGKRGFDANGLWLDWDNLEKIKSALWAVASVQNRNWQENGTYAPDMQKTIVDLFTLPGCESGSYVSGDHRVYACWMSNGTGFAFGMGASDGGFPPLRYEGESAPSIDSVNPLEEFKSDQEENELPNWFASFYTDCSYR